jgi:cytochrome c biogenesis protein
MTVGADMDVRRSLRGFWRWLTSMRTALLLLLLLALAAVPGSLLPQRPVNPEDVRGYLAAHPTSGPWLDRLWFFDVFTSPWFAAIYLLLFVSLVGCLLPRLRQHIGNLVARPPDAPARLDRLPRAAPSVARTADAATVATELTATLRARRWRVARREQADGTFTVAAEKGYLKEAGNLLFHFALLALLIGVALGSWYGWHGNRLVVAGPDGFCDTLQQYDEYELGARARATDLPPFCLTLNDFRAEYLDNGQPVRYTADVSYVEGLDGPSRAWRLEVNSPLRLDGANVYLLGHGYAPVLRYVDRFGVPQTKVAPFLPDDGLLTSTGVATFPDANVDPARPGERPAQVAFAGIYLPTLPSDPAIGRSAFPAERDPALMLAAYVGDLGLGSGDAQSVYELKQEQIDAGALTEVGQRLLRPGEVWTLPDGSRLEFVGTRPWVTVSVRHDPGDRIVLVGAAAVLVGLTVSLAGRRRRVWARVEPADGGGSLVSLGGLARTEYPGFPDEFAAIVTLLGPAADDPGATPLPPVAVGGTESRPERGQ